MAEQLNMSVGGYSKIESGKTDVAFSKIQQIAEILETDVKTIMELDTGKIFNINQYHADNGNQYGYVGVQKNFDIKMMETLIEQLKLENEFLKEMLKSKT